MSCICNLIQDGGYQFTVKVRQRSFAYVSGHNLGSQEAGGFKIGSSANLKCTECMGKADEITSLVRYKLEG